MLNIFKNRQQFPDDHHDVVAVALGEGNVFGDRLDALGVGHRRATEFLDHYCHR